MDDVVVNQSLPNIVENHSIQNGAILVPEESVPDREVGNPTKKSVQKRIIKNLLVASLCYFLFYTGFWELSNLQSTMNSAGGIGDISQAIIYGVSMFSSLFLPDLMIGKFGAKRVLVACTLLGCPYIAANMYLKWGTMIPASVLFGLINGPFVSAQAVYVDEIATRFQSTVGENLEVIMAGFFGVYTSFSEMTQIWGNVILYYIFKPGSRSVVPFKSMNCGIDFIPGDGNDTNSNLDPPPESERLLLVGIYVGIGVLSALVLGLFLDPLGNDLKDESSWKLISDRVFAASKHLKNRHQLLLIPLSIYIGMEGPFYGNEVTQAYIACSWGVHHVGFVTICFGVCGALMSLLVGPLVKCISQMAVIIFAACANVGMCILLFLWEPSPDTTSIYFVIAGVWGMGDAIWWSQVTALYGLMFPNDREAAFSNLYFWSFLGFFISYSYANYLSVAVKINILLAFLLTGMLGYLIGQLKIKCSARKEYVHIEEGQ